MKNAVKLFGIIAITAVIGFSFVSCGGGGGDGDGGGSAQQLNATAATFDDVFNSIREKPGNYVINLSGDLLDYQGTWMDTAGVNITVKGTGSNKITWKHAAANQCPLFWVEAGKLTLENIALGRGTGNTLDWCTVGIDGGTVEIKNGVTLSANEGSGYFAGVWIDRGTFVMSGGTIENCDVGVGTNGNGTSITISGGTIENCGNAVGTNGNGVSITMSSGTIRNNQYNGIQLGRNSVNCTLRISGGTISGSENGINLGGTGNKIFMTGGTIRGTESNGVNFSASNNPTNCFFTMSGGSIGGNGNWGLLVRGAGNGFEKTGGTIYGNEAGENKNSDGAIDVRFGDDRLRLRNDAAPGTTYAVTLNAAGNGIVEGSQKPAEW